MPTASSPIVARTALSTCFIADWPSVLARNEFASLYVTSSWAWVGVSPSAETMLAEKSAGMDSAK